MSKKSATRQWVAFVEYFGGPCDGETGEIGCLGSDPTSAFVGAVERDDVPEKVKKCGHFYEIEWASVKEVVAGTDEDENRALYVAYVYEGLIG